MMNFEIEVEFDKEVWIETWCVKTLEEAISMTLAKYPLLQRDNLVSYRVVPTQMQLCKASK